MPSSKSNSASLRALDTWPWPRGYYATAIENLRNAGARTIGMDVDLSSRADASQDAKLARVIAARPDSVVLPVFLQPVRAAGGGFDLIEVQPNERLRQGALFASVNLIAEADGVLRKGYFGFESASGLRPSMAAALAGRASARSDAYYIDFGIALPTLTRLSFADVLANKFDPKLVAGRNILIGATALELGDEFAVPVHGIASGIFLHALSYESILQGRMLMRPSLLFALLISLFVIAILGRERRQWSWLSVMAPALRRLRACLRRTARGANHLAGQPGRDAHIGGATSVLGAHRRLRTRAPRPRDLSPARAERTPTRIGGARREGQLRRHHRHRRCGSHRIVQRARRDAARSR